MSRLDPPLPEDVSECYRLEFLEQCDPAFEAEQWVGYFIHRFGGDFADAAFWWHLMQAWDVGR